MAHFPEFSLDHHQLMLPKILLRCCLSQSPLNLNGLLLQPGRFIQLISCSTGSVMLQTMNVEICQYAKTDTRIRSLKVLGL